MLIRHFNIITTRARRKTDTKIEQESRGFVDYSEDGKSSRSPELEIKQESRTPMCRGFVDYLHRQRDTYTESLWSPSQDKKFDAEIQ